MAFTDPQAVTINAVSQTLPRISSGVNSGVFQKDDASVKLSVSHTYAKGRARRLIRLDHAKVAADPLMAGINVRATGAVYLVTDFPQTGYTVAEAKQIVDALTAYLTATSGARATQLLGGEN
jgi:hypothetical protein